MASVTFVFVFIVITVYQLSYSYAIYSAILTTWFAYSFSWDFDQFYQKWSNETSADEPKIQISPFKDIENANASSEQLNLGHRDVSDTTLDNTHNNEHIVSSKI